MKITFLGAAQTVTGSCFVIETKNSRFAVDCGMFQGNSAIEERNFETENYRPEELEACMREAGFREVQVYHGQDQMICVTGKK